jgi:PAS domain S-box-containing protein
VRGDPLLEPWRWTTFPELTGLDLECMAEGADGTMWFGSVNGAWSYDGMSWFLHTNASLLGSGVVSISTQADGTVWVAGRWGVSHFKSGAWSGVFPGQGKRFGDIRKLIRGREDSMWAATRWGALHHSRGKWILHTDTATAARLRGDEQFKFLDVQVIPASILTRRRGSAVPSNRTDFTEIVMDARGRIWLGTAGGEILCHDPLSETSARDAWSLYNEADGLVCGGGPTILPLHDGAIWVAYGASSGHLNILEDGDWRAVRLADHDVPGDCSQLLQTRDGVVWFSSRYVVTSYQDGKWRNYEKPEVPIPSARNHLLQTADGALWIAGSSTEIKRVDYQTSRWLTLNDLNFHCETANGTQWFLHRDGRVITHENGAWSSHGPEDGMIDGAVTLVEARDGSIWAAGSHGNTAATARFTEGKWTRHVHDRLSWGVEWRGVLAASDGSVWFSATVDSSGPKEHIAGLMQFRDGQWIHHHQPQPGAAPGSTNPHTSLPATQRPEPIGKFLSMGESRDGRIWAGRNILIVKDREKWGAFVPPEETRLGVIETIFTTSQRDLWIGSRQFGAWRYNDRGWQQFQGKGSLEANSVRSIVETADGSIWAATDRGLSRFDGRTWSSDLLPAALNVPHESGTLRASPSGALWINRFPPHWVRRAWPKSVASDALGNEFWSIRHRFDAPAPETMIDAQSGTVAQPGNLFVAWRGIARWREARDARLQYSFRLDGEPWSEFTSQVGHAFLTLPPGPHRLEVRARNEDFNVDPTPAVMEFVVLPPVWRQAWFILLVAVFLGVTGVQSVRVIRERSRLRKSNQQLASQIAARERTEAALRNVLRHARTMVMHNLVTAPEGWRPEQPGWSVADFRWERTFQDEKAARDVLPLDVAPGESYGEGWERSKHPDDRGPMAVVATRALAEGASNWQQDFRCIDRDGRTHWFAQAASIETLGQGRWRVTTINTEITERVLAQEALRTSEERLSSIFRHSPTAISIVRAADNRFVEVNDAFVRSTGYGREEIIGRTPFELNLWENSRDREHITRELKESGVAHAFKVRGRRKSGEIGIGIGAMTRIVLNGEPHLVSLIQDFTEQERAEEARRESDQRFRQVTENINEVFWLTDANKQQMIYISPAYRGVWGRSCESLYANPASWIDSIHPDDKERVRSALASQAQGSYDIEYRIVRPDDTVRWVHDRAFPIRDDEGKIYRVAGVAADITAKRELEEQLRQTQKLESLGTLAGGIAHDFNNILTGVLGSAEIALLDLHDSHPARRWIAIIFTAAERAKDLVKQILTFGRKQESAMAPLLIQRDITEALRLLRSSIPTTIRIESRIDATCPPIIADATQIHQVIMNLCTNAWHAVPARGGIIEVSLAPVDVTPEFAAARLDLSSGPHVLLTVRDNGCGMTPETLARIFEPFFTTKAQGHGTGLGLAVVHGIVQSHHGAIFVQSTPGGGTCFEVFLPTTAEAGAETARGEVESSLAKGRQENILLVDDDSVALAATCGQLEHLGYRVTAVSDARNALKLFQARPAAFDLVLSDSTMPGLSGRDLCEKILGLRPGMPVLLASGFADAKAFEEARAAGVREVLRKPAPIAVLAATIARHVRNGTVPPVSTLRRDGGN